MSTYNPADMEHMYDQLNRFYDQMGRTYEAMRETAPWMLAGSAGESGRPGGMPRFFEEWDARRGDDGGRRDYEGRRRDYEGYRPRGRFEGDVSPFGPAPAFRYLPGPDRGDREGGFDRREDAYRPEGRYPRGDRGRREGASYEGYSVDSGRRYELREVDGEFVCICEVPGFETADIECTYDDGVFYIDAYRAADGDAETVWMRSPRRLSERVPLPRPVDVDDITATYRRGILEVRMPMAGGEGRPGQHITIRD